MRTRKQLTRQQSSHTQRLQKTLEVANIKLDSAITDIVGKSGRAMIQALIEGETDPIKLAALADRRIKASPQQFREALHGRMTATPPPSGTPRSEEGALCGCCLAAHHDLPHA
jgi:transposase